MDDYKRAKAYCFMDALEAYIDARIHYAAAEPEWRNRPEAEEEALTQALLELLSV